MASSRNSKGMSEPPEGAIVGESVPPESEPDNFDEQLIEETMHTMKARGRPFTLMTDAELREKALEFLHKYGGDI